MITWDKMDESQRETTRENLSTIEVAFRDLNKVQIDMQTYVLYDGLYEALKTLGKLRDELRAITD